MINYTLLFVGLLYITFLPGFVVTEYLLPRLKFYIKLPLYFVFSVLVSTYFSYFSALIMGFNRNTILFNFLIFILLSLPIVVRKYKELLVNVKTEYKLILVSLLVFFIFFIPLNQGIFRKVNDSYIMSGPNWQDTAMHLSIIESLSEGNFPPIAPYFSGEKLNYYYFSDLHAAIANVMFGDFFPYILNLINPFLALTMFLSVFALSNKIIKNRVISYLTAFLSVFYGSLGFVDLIKDAIVNKENYFNLLTNNAYHINANSSILMVPMADYFLQNRPMMVGLPVFIIVILLIHLSFKANNYKLILIAGFTNALLLKFQFFGFLLGIMFYGFSLFYSLIVKKINIKSALIKFIVFIMPSFLMLFLFGLDKVGNRSLFQVVMDTFTFEGFLKEGLVWNLKFVINNFNLPIFLFLATPILPHFYKDNNFKIIYLFTLSILIIPFLIKFTIYNYDMFKFFYYALPLLAFVFGFFTKHIYKKNKNFIFISIFVVLVSSITSLNMITHAFLNKSSAYSVSEYEVGLWIRENTPQKSVFITHPSVHNGASDIGGRIRVLSYINWPHSHGFNQGVDNVFSRNSDIQNFFENPERVEILDKYKVDYVYLGPEERSNFKLDENKIESVLFLEKVYENQDFKVFARKK